MMKELQDALPAEDFLRLPLTWEAAFQAGKYSVRGPRRRGLRRSPCPTSTSAFMRRLRAWSCSRAMRRVAAPSFRVAALRYQPETAE